ncbi:UDP-N-acetylmuramate dehydrogenase [Pseudobacteriovorax antillogorgiicola]|uniref:UDP-N-acetylenolpyruvoylglucosamine reductase n=1 Tax=Pseudobacteriovorax antillogorgiicola TaxID=1513793 RepID=A0A1Y6CJ18_9BACT|nr:FAD-binding protein [Pseudobacteriovorax antillogorgiicola]TCS46629.1 UDP-N-acetylenolpyruvoylglucosamine reductase [Pseudobacteriovorax antillogorgiicola]SMF66044.1 UDP-N-acetylenolpyruvoylglucosamine reductase [Pseudobacteriovorax antillogorgiicola]
MLKDIAYYKTGGTCNTLHQPESIDQLAEIVSQLHQSKTPYFVIGGGTNSLVLDDHFPGDVIAFTKLKSIKVTRNSIYAEAGVENTMIAQTALSHSLAGAAWMNRLPGQIGGTVRMNARCYGGEISEIASTVIAVSQDGVVKTYDNQGNLFRGYKDTIFMDNGDIIAAVHLALEPGQATDIKAIMDHCETDRIQKGQFTFPSCGCVFKNDYAVGVPSGMLLDRAGAHDLNQDKVALNPKHANFVFNKGATSSDILDMTLAMRELVYKTYGVWLSYEMEILGRLPDRYAAKVRETRPQQFNEAALEPLRLEFSGRKKP